MHRRYIVVHQPTGKRTVHESRKSGELEQLLLDMLVWIHTGRWRLRDTAATSKSTATTKSSTAVAVAAAVSPTP